MSAAIQLRTLRSIDRDEPSQKEVACIDPDKPFPHNISIIMDGNGRWAVSQGLPRMEGHRKGADALRRVTEAAAELGVKQLTVYAWSTENWKRRAEEEVTGILTLMRFYLKSELKELVKNNVRFRVIGDYKAFPADIFKLLNDTIETTRTNTGLTLCMALNYGGRPEILKACKEIAQEVRDGRLDVDAIDDATFSGHLWTEGMADPDLFIRTSGERRLSNFLLWQLSYSEMIFEDKHWPDFDKDTLVDAILEFQSRERRYGGHGK